MTETTGMTGMKETTETRQGNPEKNNKNNPNGQPNLLLTKVTSQSFDTYKPKNSFSKSIYRLQYAQDDPPSWMLKLATLFEQKPPIRKTAYVIKHPVKPI